MCNDRDRRRVVSFDSLLAISCHDLCNDSCPIRVSLLPFEAVVQQAHRSFLRYRNFSRNSIFVSCLFAAINPIHKSKTRNSWRRCKRPPCKHHAVGSEFCVEVARRSQRGRRWGLRLVRKACSPAIGIQDADRINEVGGRIGRRQPGRKVISEGGLRFVRAFALENLYGRYLRYRLPAFGHCRVRAAANLRSSRMLNIVAVGGHSRGGPGEINFVTFAGDAQIGYRLCHFQRWRQRNTGAAARAQQRSCEQAKK